MSTNVVDLTAQRMSALQQGNAKRFERAASKQALKLGQEELRTALDRACWRDARVLEVLGYAAIGELIAKPDPRRALPSQVGTFARRVAAACDVTHFTFVSSLSAQRRDELAAAVAYEARRMVGESPAMRSENAATAAS